MRRITTLILIGMVALVPTAGAGAAKLGATGGRTLTATLVGDPDPTASGHFRGTFNAGQELVCYELSYSDLGMRAVAAHIHRGASGVDGPVVVPLETPSSGLVRACTSADGALIDEIIDNPEGFYVNVHNVPFVGGSARGQLTR